MRLDGTQPDEANDDDYLLWCDTDDLVSASETASTVADDVSDARMANQENGSKFYFFEIRVKNLFFLTEMWENK